MLTSKKDTVKLPVKIDKVECTFPSCPYTADTWSGSAGEREFLLTFHAEKEHPAPMVVLVEEYVDKMSWDTFKTWWSSYREIFAPTDDLSGPLLMFLGEAAYKISYELCGGDRFKQWTETGLLEEAESLVTQDEAAKE